MSPAFDPDSFDAFEAAAWSRAAPRYDEFAGRITRRTIDDLLDAADVRADARVLDVATGTGAAAAAARARGADVVGVDVAAGMLERARALHPDVEFREASVYELPFADGSFEAAVCNLGLLHFGRPQDAVAELARVLAPGGRLALTVWDVPARSRLQGVFFDTLAEEGVGLPPGVPPGPPMYLFADDDELTSLLNGAGLEQVDVQTIAFFELVSGFDELWEGLVEGGVRLQMLVRGHDAETVRRIRAGVELRVEPYRDGDELALPVSAKLGTGRKPA